MSSQGHASSSRGPSPDLVPPSGGPFKGRERLAGRGGSSDSLHRLGAGAAGGGALALGDGARPPHLQAINTMHLQPLGPPSPTTSSASSSSPRLAQPLQPTSNNHHAYSPTPSSSSSHSHHSPRKNSSSPSPSPLQPNFPHHPPSSSHSHSHSNHSSSQHDARSRSKTRDPAAAGQTCAKCELPMSGQFVRALGTVYHLDCFRCHDCNKVVAAKFFPVDADGGGLKQYPLCETDYFRRLNLLCTKCGMALRGSYITALDMKFHVEHFTCSVCPTVFGPQDSYYEHAGSVYCHFHYSTRFAVKCTGCRTAILKQFVEINRNSTDEHWHPECYMIHKFWNIKLAASPPPPSLPGTELSTSTASTSTSLSTIVPDSSTPVESARDATGPPSRALEEAEYILQEQSETPATLKERQKVMEQQVYRIWTVLSAFEESSAACISEMLRFVSSGSYIEGVGMAEKFVGHVETLFSAIDELAGMFKEAGAKEISHVREARMLCKKVVNFFSLLSHTHEAGARKMSITQELLSLVTGLAHYLKILIRIALTAALKLEREYGNRVAINAFLSRLDRLARDPEASKLGNGRLEGEKSRSYGYKSLTRAVGTLVGQGEATSDLCEGCKLTVEEECARFGTSLRWHLPCLRCSHCGKKQAAKEEQPPPPVEGQLVGVYLKEFRIEEARNGGGFRGGKTFCAECAASVNPGGTREGFEYVTKLEQYAFLLCVALNKLYALLKQKGVVPSSPTEEDDNESSEQRSLYDAYRDSTDIKRMKSVNLDRKLSSTQARIPKRSTVVQSPSGRVAQPNDPNSPNTSKPPVPSRKDQPILDPSRAATVPRPALPSSASSNPSYRSLPPEAISAPPRPAYNRATTAVRIVDDQGPESYQFTAEPPGLGGAQEPTQDEKGITLADLPQVMEAEQAREQHRFIPQRTGALLSELSALEYFIVKHVAALMLASEQSAFREFAPLDELLDIIDARKNTFWGKLFKGGNEKKNVKKKGVFGIALDVLVERNGADSMHGAGPGSVRVPSFVDDVISAMKQMDMSVEGIFRKNGNIRRLKDLSEALDRDSGSVNLSDDNPVQLAALLKKFLRDLPDPLMSFKLFHLFLATQRIENLEDRKKTMHLVCCLMPKPHRDTMEVIFVFLKWVASFSHVDEETGSKMDLQNLATVICPNILYSKSKDPYKDESFSAVRAVHELLEFQDEFWQVPEEFAAILNDQDLFNNPSQLTSKEILARAENYVRKPRKNAGMTTRGEVHPLRPDFQQAYSAPAVASRPGGSGGPLPNGLRPNERPTSFSTYAPNPAGLPLRQPQPVRPPPQGAGGPASYHGTTSPGYAPAPYQPQPSPDQFRRPSGDGPRHPQIAAGNQR
ncbi:Rho GTPase-activating protein [Pseudohyphozyma bogoriensis]|nr:Rho GTPase-activating protein [Pseudohyphozyma bogoriensis]